MKLKIVISVLLGLSFTVSANAKEFRGLIAVGNNRGLPSDKPLAYAEKDAKRFSNLLQKNGDVPRSNVVLLQGKSTRELSQTIHAMSRKTKWLDPKYVTLFILLQWALYGQKHSPRQATIRAQTPSSRASIGLRRSASQYHRCLSFQDRFNSEGF